MTQDMSPSIPARLPLLLLLPWEVMGKRGFGREAGDRLLLKAEFKPPAPIRGEKGPSEGRLEVCGDSAKLFEAELRGVVVLVKEPDPLSTA